MKSIKIPGMPPTVTFLSDFGHEDSYVSEVKGVLLKACHPVQLIDITHQVEPFDIYGGAFQLLRSYHYFPKGTFHLAVVDPGVGTTRKAIYVRTKHYHFIGPNNGLMLWAVRDCEKKQQSPAEIFEIPDRPGVGATFHGRDLFAPFVTELINESTSAKDLKALETLEGEEFPGSRELDDIHRGEVIGCDRYGNVITSIPLETAPSGEAQIGHREERHLDAKSYFDIEKNKVSLIRGSHGFWELSCRCASAWERLKVKRGDEVTLYPKGST